MATLAAPLSLSESNDPAARLRVQDSFAADMQNITPRLRRFAYSLTRNPTATDDLVQEALLRAWAARDSFSAGTNFKAWIFRIAHNCFITELRRAWRHTEWNSARDEALLVQIPAQEEGVYARDLKRLLGSVPQSQRMAIEAVSIDGLSYDEAAHRLGIAVGTLKSRVGRGRAAISERMNAERL